MRLTPRSVKKRSIYDLIVYAVIGTEEIHGMLSAVDKYGAYVYAAPSGEIMPDMSDLPFYEVVPEKRDNDAYLVTGNINNFPRKPFIVTASQMLDILKSGAR